jgi:hypothetical protein
MALPVLVVTPQPGDERVVVVYDHNALGAVDYLVTATAVGAAQSTASATAPASTAGTTTLTGLTNGTPYVIQVDARGPAGALLARGSAVATPVSPLTLSIAEGDASLSVQYVSTVAPPAAQYRATATAPNAAPVTATATGATGTIVLAGLNNGIEYTVVLDALNAANPPAVLASRSAKATPRSALTVTAVPGDGRIDVAWVLLAVLTSLDHYVVSLAPGGQSTTVPKTGPLAAAFTTLTNGTDYEVTVAAVNAAGTKLAEAKVHATPTSVLALTVIPGDKKLTILYGLQQGATLTAASYRITVTPAAGGAAVGGTPLTRPATANPSVTVSGLTNGQPYSVVVEALDNAGGVLSSVTGAGTPHGTVGLALGAPNLQPISVIDPSVLALRRLVADAARVGGKWRFDYLRAQVLAIAHDATAFEQELEGLMTLDVVKVAAGELLMPPYLLGTLNKLQDVLSKVQSLPLPDVGPPARLLADAINTLVLLERLLDWLAGFDAVDFWVHLFGNLIDDIAAFDTGLSRTRRYLRGALGTTGFQSTILAMFDAARDEILKLVDDTAAPLRDSVGDAVSATAAAMQAVFDAFDEPLLVAAGAEDAAGVVNANPLGSLSQQLSTAVEAAVADVRAAVERALDVRVNPDTTAGLFEAIVTAYILLPLLAALAVAVAGGPISAGVLAAAVTLAAEELVHLLARWLAGPLRQQLAEAQAKVDDAVRGIAAVVGAALPSMLGATTDPSKELTFLAGQLGSLRDLLPKAFLDGAAGLLADARDEVLDTATGLALAAEQALGFENATVFDEIDRSYRSDLPAAPRLPGGLGSRTFATAELLRDLGRLEYRRIDLLDGKEIEVPLRLSLFRELGGQGDPAQPAVTGFIAGELPRLLRGEEVAVRLREDALLERSHPGLYRVLISDVRARAVFDQPLTGMLRTLNVPLQVTHLGESRTRIRTDANLSKIRNDEKWGNAFVEGDRDPQIAALGFATLVRRGDVEAATFNLLAQEAPTAVAATETATASAHAGLPAGSPLSRDAQYRPFENRGLEGTLLLQLPAAAAIPALDGVTGALLGGAAAPQLLDIILDVQVRACVDTDLAAAVRARRRERADELAVAGAAVGGVTGFTVAPPLPLAAASNRRTIHFSLRGYRDELLRLFQALLPQLPSTPATGASWSVIPTTPELGTVDRNEPFKPLPLDKPTGAQTTLPKFSLAFAPTAPTATPATAGADLAALGRKLVVTPAMLGIASDLVKSTAKGAGLVGISVSIVPTQAGATVLRTVPVANPIPWTGAVTAAAVATVDEAVHVSVLAGANGRLYDARRLLGVWGLFAPGPTNLSSFTRLATASVARELYACGLSGGFLYYARRSAAGWVGWDTIGRYRPGAPSPAYTAVGAAEVDGELHTCVVQTVPNKQNLYHRQRAANGRWTGSEDVLAQAGRTHGSWTIVAALDVDCAERDGELHVLAHVVQFRPPPAGTVTIGSPALVKTVRHPDGTWSPFRNLHLGNPFNPIVGITFARVDRDLHLCWCEANGKVWHAIERLDGSISSETEVTVKAGKPGNFTTVRGTEANGELTLVGVTSNGKVWLTTRRVTDTWDPWTEVTTLTATTVQIVDPLSTLTMLADGPLAAVLPQFATTAKAPDGRLTVAPLTSPTVSFDTLFDAASNARLDVNLDDAIANGLIYDVIFSITYGIPVETITPST